MIFLVVVCMCVLSILLSLLVCVFGGLCVVFFCLCFMFSLCLVCMVFFEC